MTRNCIHCHFGFNHGCWDDCCRATNGGEDCKSAVACPFCNGDYKEFHDEEEDY